MYIYIYISISWVLTSRFFFNKIISTFLPARDSLTAENTYMVYNFHLLYDKTCLRSTIDARVSSRARVCVVSRRRKF